MTVLGDGRRTPLMEGEMKMNVDQRACNFGDFALIYVGGPTQHDFRGS